MTEKRKRGANETLGGGKSPRQQFVWEGRILGCLGKRKIKTNSQKGGRFFRRGEKIDVVIAKKKGDNGKSEVGGFG